MKTETAYLACGCFWHPELNYSDIKGIIKTDVGYMGGDEKKYPNPTYDEVCSDKTGYAETVKVTFNPEIISYEELLDAFWGLHDPTQLNRQGADVGSQYRSVIFYINEKQKQEAEESKKKIQEKFNKKNKKVVTELRKAGKFFMAEEYHQDYLKKQKRGLF